MVRGNPVRAASTVDAIAGGEAPPPELDVVETPRSGIAVTHRLVTLMSGDPAALPGWTSASSVRAKAEPQLNAWVGKLLGDPRRVRVLVERLDRATGEVVGTREVRLDQLGLAPLDLVLAAEGGEAGQQAEIEQRVLYVTRRQSGGPPADARLRVSAARDPAWQLDELGYGELSELLRSVRDLVAGVRPLDAGDLDLPERNTNPSLDLAELEGRAAAAEEAVRETAEALAEALTSPASADLEVIRDVLLGASGFGVPGAVPLSPAGSAEGDRQTVIAQAGSVERELAGRVSRLEGLVPVTGAEDRRNAALARFRIIFGAAFQVLPRFTPANRAELEKAVGDSSKIQGGDPLAAATWAYRMACVREGVGRLQLALDYSEAAGGSEPLRLTVAQLPFRADDRWVALPLDAGEQLPGGRLSLVVQSGAPLRLDRPLAGLLIDEWIEVVPSASQTTGIALQYDQPKAAPPQAILLAVPPDLAAPWTVFSLQQVLLETLDLSRLRAVDPDALGEVGQYLPASYLVHNASGQAAVSTDFAPLI